MTRNHKYDYLMRAGLGKGAKKVVKVAKNPLSAALLEFDQFDVGLGQLPFMPTAPPSQYPITGAAPMIMARPRAPEEIQTQAAAAQKPGIIEQILNPIKGIAVLGIGAIVLVNIVPPLLEHLSRRRAPPRE